MNADLLLLVLVAALMGLGTAALLKWVVEARTRPQAWVATFLLAMMGEMWVAAVVYLASPSTRTLVEGLAVSGALMVASIAPILFALLRNRTEGSVPAGGAPAPAPRLGIAYAGLVAGIVLANELLMGWGLLLAAGSSVAPGGLVSAAASVVDSPWFLFTMAAEMLLTSLWLRDRLSRPVLAILLTQSGIMLFSPPALGGTLWTGLAIYVSSALMIGLFVYLFEHLYRHGQLSGALSSYLIELLAVYALMMGGLFVWLYFGDPTAFALSIVLEMVVFYAALVRPGEFSGAPAPPWQLRSHWTFALLSLVFVAEVFMGAVLSVQIQPAQYLAGYPFLPLSGAPATIALNAVSNGFWFLATSVASTWFLLMMGIEMGALVVFKYRETRNLENRVRLLLMMGSYGAFAVFYPSLYFGLAFPQAPDPSTVPVLGWSMGIGSYPIAFGVFGVLLATYAITGALTVLFGRRVVCSVFCTAPLMYQGTALDSMKSFNRSSRIGRKYLSSRLSGLYSGTTAAVMVALVGTSALSYLDSIGVTNVYLQGNDPSVFFFTFSFSIVWYLLFISIPYVGNYNCVTMGWCYTGTIAQAFHKIGFFKLKVRDRQVCRDCTTLDCAKGCPVGLVDMPGHFRKTGEFRSTKCCGVGDCVEVCPHDNLYIADVRHWVRRRLGRPETRARRTGPPAPVTGRGLQITARPARAAPFGADAVPLPMVGVRSPPVRTSAPSRSTTP